jgi:hypothetical protein
MHQRHETIDCNRALSKTSDNMARISHKSKAAMNFLREAAERKQSRVTQIFLLLSGLI